MKKREGLEFLASLAPWKGKGGFTLGKIKRVLEVLGNPQDKPHSIHVTGTNGKGSVSVAIASIIGQTGLKVGLTTSPHLVSQTERIVIDGEPITDEALNGYAIAVKRAAIKAKEDISYFEGITVAAFVAFDEAKVDWSVLEVGLGGRLDATNVVSRPKACVIVSVDKDHTEILGDTIAKIAAEKAGIIKNGATVIVGNLTGEALTEVRIACKRANAAELRIFGSDYWIKNEKDRVRFTSNHVSRDETFLFKPSLLGEHQAHNMAVAMEAVQTLGFRTPECIKGVESVRWPGRLESVTFNGLNIVMDGAHNGAGIDALVRYLEGSKLSKLNILFGVLDRPEWKEMVSKLSPFVAKWFLSSPANDRAVKSEEVASFLSGIGIKPEAFDNFETVLSAADPGQPLLVTGSLYLVGEFRSFLKNTMRVNNLDTKLWSKRIDR